MPKLRFSVVLPILQVIITAVLTWWADRVEWMFLADTSRAPGRFVFEDVIVFYLRQVWKGVNAPTYPFCLVNGPGTGRVWQFSLSEVLYFCSVAILWFLVGRFMDRRNQRTDAEEGRVSTKAAKAWLALLVAWGLALLALTLFWAYEDLHLFPDSGAFANLRFEAYVRPYELVESVLFLAWSLILIIMPGKRLVFG
jgi:hypothetical protein